ncbi:hypothetical protein CesoFtcFv8_021948 [Champsocephalus esox]|uniref:Uncharacterized protein n=1 Tax=Champsocephalus esox TaxID=159716 RepID=A0AAN8B9I4_9TELE|nr:hypothetical protein CesoFtcFv8_021948 [Champsocephalus esox]
MRQSSNQTDSTQMKVLLYPGALAGSAGQRFEALVERGGSSGGAGPVGRPQRLPDTPGTQPNLQHLTATTPQSHRGCARPRQLSNPEAPDL